MNFGQIANYYGNQAKHLTIFKFSKSLEGTPKSLQISGH